MLNQKNKGNGGEDLRVFDLGCRQLRYPRGLNPFNRKLSACERGTGSDVQDKMPCPSGKRIPAADLVASLLGESSRLLLHPITMRNASPS
jgi:hypothetical protein